MSKLAKKIFVAAFAAIVVAAVAVPPSAQAQTAAELQAQISALLAQIQALQTQLAAAGGGGGAGVSGIPAGFQFNQNLTVGSTGNDVMYLQMALNSYNTSPIASSGAGSPGSETSYFGPITAGGVTAFQNMYASEVLTPVGLTSGTGFFGPSTRAKMNSMLASAPSPTPGTPSPTPGTPSATPGVISTPGIEGSLLVTINATPASGAILDTGETQAVTGIDVEAQDSDILVSRFDMEFDTRPWLYISEMTISDGADLNKTIAVTKGNSTEVTVGSKYSVRMSGLNVLVPEGTTTKFTITMKAVTGLPVGTTTKDIVLTVIANAVRGTDGAGLTQNAPTAALSTRTITVQEPTTADLEITAHPDNPEARAVIVNNTANTTGVVLAVFNVKAKNNDAIIRNMKFIDTQASSVASGTLSVVTLYDGNTELSSTSSIGSATATLANVDLLVPKDTTKTLTLKGEVKKSKGNYAEGEHANVKIEDNPDGFDAEDATSFATATVSGSTITPGMIYNYVKAPLITLASTEIVGVAGASGSSTPTAFDGKVRINVTAQGGDIYLALYSSTDASNAILTEADAQETASTTLTASFTSNADFGSSANDTYVIRSGSTRWFEAAGNIAACATSATAFFTRLQLVNVKWGTSVTTANGAPANTWAWGMTDFRTPEAFLPACT